MAKNERAEVEGGVIEKLTYIKKKPRNINNIHIDSSVKKITSNLM